MGDKENKSLGAGLNLSTSDEANLAPLVLVVDDDLQIRQLIATHLRRVDCRVDTAGDGAEAWKALNEVSYNLLITDHNMPKMTGLELIKKLRSEDMTLPVILVSGAMPTEELKRHSSLRIEAMLSKPFTLFELLKNVKKVLGSAEHSPLADLSAKLEAAFQNTVSKVQEPAMAPTQQQRKPSNRILVVDDNPDVRQLSIDVLSAANYEVKGVKDGADGWDALQTDSNYDLIITDNQMPRMTGIELIEKLRSSGMRPRVIMATGSLPGNEFARRPWLKPDAMLQRPFTNDTLLDAVRNVLRTENGGDGKNLSELPLNPV